MKNKDAKRKRFIPIVVTVAVLLLCLTAGGVFLNGSPKVVRGISAGNVIDLGDTAPSANDGTGTIWTYNSTTNRYTILNGADVTVIGAKDGSNNPVAVNRKLVVANSATVRITLNNVAITNTDTGDSSPLSLGSGANVTLILADGSNNALYGGYFSVNTYWGNAGIETTGATLRITTPYAFDADTDGNPDHIGDGSGKLTAIGGYSANSTSSFWASGAGIGGSTTYNGTGGAGGTVIIDGGDITVTSNLGAGIGGAGAVTASSTGGAGGTVTITGGVVRANGGYTAAIGGGASGVLVASGGAGATVNISGGTVYASAQYIYISASDIRNPPVIGGGFRVGNGGASNTGTCTINGDAVVSLSCDPANAGNYFTGTTTLTKGILFRDSAGVMYHGGASGGAGTLTPTDSFALTAAQTLTLTAGQALTVPNGATLTNNGTITGPAAITVATDGALTNNGTITGSASIAIAAGGTLTNNGTISCTAASPSTLDIAAGGTLTNGGTGVIRGPLTVTVDGTLNNAAGALINYSDGWTSTAPTNVTNPPYTATGKIIVNGRVNDSGTIVPDVRLLQVTPPNKVNYIAYDTVDLTGLELEVVGWDGVPVQLTPAQMATVTSAYEANGRDPNSFRAGDTKFIVSYYDSISGKTLTAGIAVTVVKKAYTGKTHAGIDTEWIAGKTLGDIASTANVTIGTITTGTLTANWRWQTPTDSVAMGTNTYTALYNDDTDNYNDFPFSVSVTAKMQQGTVTHPDITGITYAANTPLSTLDYVAGPWNDQRLEEHYWWADPTTFIRQGTSTYDALYNSAPTYYFDAALTVKVTALADAPAIPHHTIYADWFSGMTLNDVKNKLRSMYTWKSLTTPVQQYDAGNPSTYTYAAWYNPDPNLYNNATVNIQVIASVKIPYPNTVSHPDITVVWFSGMTLTDVESQLDSADWAWFDPATPVTKGTYQYSALYNPDPIQYTDTSYNITVKALDQYTGITHPTIHVGHIRNMTLQNIGGDPTGLAGLMPDYTWKFPNNPVQAGTYQYDAFYCPDPVNYVPFALKVTVTADAKLNQPDPPSAAPFSISADWTAGLKLSDIEPAVRAKYPYFAAWANPDAFIQPGTANHAAVYNIDGSQYYDIDIQVSVTAKGRYDMSGVTFTDATVVYDGTERSLTVSGTLPPNVSVSYLYDSVAATGKTAAGIYAVTAVFASSDLDYYVPADMTAVLTVTAKSVPDMTGVTFASGTFTYDGTEKSLAVSGALPSGVSVSYLYDGAAGTGKTVVGTYTVTARFAVTDTVNYDPPADMTASLTINKGAPDMTGITFPDGVLPYDGTEQSLTVQGTLPAGVSVSYLYDGVAATGKTDNGTYAVTAVFAVADPNYDAPANMTATLVIFPQSSVGTTPGTPGGTTPGTTPGTPAPGTPGGPSLPPGTGGSLDGLKPGDKLPDLPDVPPDWKWDGWYDVDGNKVTEYPSDGRTLYPTWKASDKGFFDKAKDWIVGAWDTFLKNIEPNWWFRIPVGFLGMTFLGWLFILIPLKRRRKRDDGEAAAGQGK